ncbi:hypothetical protein BCR44DRAFT_1429936, partial [Catenaria anguillulae PL171]
MRPFRDPTRPILHFPVPQIDSYTCLLLVLSHYAPRPSPRLTNPSPPTLQSNNTRPWRERRHPLELTWAQCKAI